MKVKFNIPCYMAETKRLERFFEEKALEGYFPLSIHSEFQYADFEKGEPETRHYCVDTYQKELEAKDLKTDEFTEYRDLCEKSGWTYCCCYKNLVVFFSRDLERPMELQTDEDMALETLRNVTLKTEKAFLGGQVKEMVTMAGLMAFIYAGMLLSKWFGDTRTYQVTGIFIYSAYIVVVCMLPVTVYYMGYRKLEKSLNEDGTLPDREAFWDWENIRIASFIPLGVVMFLIYLFYPPRLLYFGYAGSGAIVLVAGVFLFLGRQAANGFSLPGALRCIGRKKLNLLYVIFFFTWVCTH